MLYPAELWLQRWGGVRLSVRLGVRGVAVTGVGEKWCSQEESNLQPSDS